MISFADSLSEGATPSGSAHARASTNRPAHHDVVMYPDTMRTTVDIDDEVLAAARSIAEADRRSLGNVLSELARKGLVPSQRVDDEFPTFPVPADAPPLTIEMVERAMDE